MKMKLSPLPDMHFVSAVLSKKNVVFTNGKSHHFRFALFGQNSSSIIAYFNMFDHQIMILYWGLEESQKTEAYACFIL